MKTSLLSPMALLVTLTMTGCLAGSATGPLNTHTDPAETDAQGETQGMPVAGDVRLISLDDAVSLTFTHDSLGGPRVDGDACQESKSVATWTLATSEVEWQRCSGAPGARALKTERSALDADVAASLRARIAAAVWAETSRRNCAYDGNLYGMVVTLSAGPQLYVHENLNCYQDGRRVAADVRQISVDLWASAPSDTP